MSFKGRSSFPAVPSSSVLCDVVSQRMPLVIVPGLCRGHHPPRPTGSVDPAQAGALPTELCARGAQHAQRGPGGPQRMARPCFGSLECSLRRGTCHWQSGSDHDDARPGLLVLAGLGAAAGQVGLRPQAPSASESRVGLGAGHPTQPTRARRIPAVAGGAPGGPGPGLPWSVEPRLSRQGDGLGGS